MTITLEKAIELSGAQGMEMTPEQQKFLIEATEELLMKHNEEWFKENRGRLRQELEIVFNEI